MRTRFFLSAIAAVVLSAATSFSAKAAQTDNEAPAVAESSYSSYVINRTDRVKANTTDVWTVTLRAGEYYIIEVDGDGDTDLDLYVYDENGNLIDDDTDDLDYCLCSVRPKWTGTFKIKVKNYGDVYNEYSIKVY